MCREGKGKREKKKRSERRNEKRKDERKIRIQLFKDRLKDESSRLKMEVKKHEGKKNNFDAIFRFPRISENFACRRWPGRSAGQIHCARAPGGANTHIGLLASVP